ncbi:hypothetical protein FACS189426_19880 [Bacteroidia bacterium]|nr:hypothetical protein FACS189426_19880 [Bacteroidia bacterium]
MTVITFLILIAFAIFVTCLFTEVPWNVIMVDIGIGLFVLGLSIWVWGWNYDETFLLLPVGFIISLIMHSGIGLFSFIAMNKMLDIAVNILLVLWIIVGYKCFYDRNRKPVKS